MFEQYWEVIVSIGTPTIGLIIAGGIKFIKNKLASRVVTESINKVKNEIGTEEYNALVGVIKNVGVRKTVAGISKVMNELESLSQIKPLIIAMSKTHLELGVYDDSPELKEIVEQTLNNVD